MDDEKRGPGRQKVVETAEFHDAVSARVQEILPGAIQQALGPILEAVKRENGMPAVSGEAGLFASQLAQAIAQLSDRDQGIKRIPAETLAKWAHARAKLEEVIVRNQMAADELVKKAEAEGEEHAFSPNWPQWEIVGKIALDEHVTEPFTVNPTTKMPEPATAYYLGIPNLAMRPMNKAAREVFDLFVASIGAEGEVSATSGSSKNYWLSARGQVIDGMGGIPVSADRHRKVNTKQLRGRLGPGQFHPGADTINVLGTIAAPARQTTVAR